MPNRKKNKVIVPKVTPGINPITGQPSIIDENGNLRLSSKTNINRQSIKRAVHTIPPQWLPPSEPRQFSPRVASAMSALGGTMLYSKNPYLMALGYILQLPDIANDYDAVIEDTNPVTITDAAADVGGLIPQVLGKGDDIARGIEIGYDAISALTGKSPAQHIDDFANKKKRRHLDEQKPNENVERKLASQSGKDR